MNQSELNSIDYSRIQNFIIFEPGAQRVKDVDVLVRGPQLMDMFSKIQYKLELEEGLPKVILYNKIQKIGKMLDLVTNFDHIIMTKFLDRIWRRYSYLSNLGESFLDLTTFLEVFPEYKENMDALFALRLDDDEDDEEEDVKGTPDITFQAEIE